MDTRPVLSFLVGLQPRLVFAGFTATGVHAAGTTESCRHLEKMGL